MYIHSYHHKSNHKYSLEKIYLEFVINHKRIDDFCRHDMVNTLRTRQNSRHFAGEIFTYSFVNYNKRYEQAVIQIMDWRRAGDSPLFDVNMA